MSGFISAYNAALLSQAQWYEEKTVKQLRLWRDWRESISVRQLIKDHHGIVTFLGGVIILMTFATKEVLRDYLKDVSNSIDNAETVFFVSEGPEPNRFASIVNVGVSEKTRSSREILNAMLASVEDMQANEQATLDNALRLLAHLPKEKQTEVKAKIPTISRERSIQLWGLLFPDPSVKTKGGHQPDAVAVDKGSIIFQGEELQYARIIGFSKSCFDAAESEKKERDKWYKRTTWASYGFYILGWGIGLLGRIYGVEGATDE